MSGARADPLCRLDEIPDGTARGFSVGKGSERREIFILRRGRRIDGYLNVCPHTGSPLDWQPDQFLSPDRRHFQCATHGAVFRFDDGLCIAGPCPGKQLERVAVALEDDRVSLANPL